MQTFTELSSLRKGLATWRERGATIAFVPTMGNLHAGHFSLIARARQLADHVVASVFVNPTQFGPNEDFDQYPRTPDEDAAGLAKAGCDALWLPSVDEMYPFGIEATVKVAVPGVTRLLDGAHRPGHFDGVATVVSRLFNQVQPDVAVFGRKDYQQLAVIRYMVRDMAFPVEIVGAPTFRADDGLALSSRNQYLDATQRAKAPALYATLQTLARDVQDGRDIASAQAAGIAHLRSLGFEPDYLAVHDRTLGPANSDTDELVVLVAARLGKTRLIDNLEFSRFASSQNIQ
jgi:pantoate--beta-alanine ligase